MQSDAAPQSVHSSCWTNGTARLPVGKPSFLRAGKPSAICLLVAMGGESFGDGGRPVGAGGGRAGGQWALAVGGRAASGRWRDPSESVSRADTSRARATA